MVHVNSKGRKVDQSCVCGCCLQIDEIVDFAVDTQKAAMERMRRRRRCDVDAGQDSAFLEASYIAMARPVLKRDQFFLTCRGV